LPFLCLVITKGAHIMNLVVMVVDDTGVVVVVAAAFDIVPV
jgi:hypothetical protein